MPRLGLGQLVPPDGAFYLYVDVSHLTDDSLGFCRSMLEECGIGAAPGIDFDTGHGQGCIRLSFALSAQQVERAIELLRGWLPRQTSRRRT
ncbi:MAG: aminotransferase class I/II-fold pyridoxal phosphate-dependent enzyme [Steroidobacteraceae bacterium]